MTEIDVVGLGHILMDISIFVNNYPGVDELAEIKDLRYGGGGSAANLAVGIRRLGKRSGFIGSVGFDDFGRILLDELIKEGVDISHVKIAVNKQSCTSFIGINRHGNVIIFEYLGAGEEVTPKDLDPSYIASAKILHITSFRLDTAIEAARIANEHGVLVSIDPGRKWEKHKFDYIRKLLENADILILNALELSKLTRTDDESKAIKILDKYGVEHVIIKKGGQGSTAYINGEKYEQPVFPVKVVDTTGAGDAFDAGYLYGILEKWPIEKTLRFASAVAAIKVSRKGARSIPTRQEVEEFLANQTR